MPLYSIRAWGKFYGKYPFGSFYSDPARQYGYCIYQRYHTLYGLICIKNRYYNAAPRNVSWLSPYQTKLAAGVSYWQGLTDAEKAIYNSYSYPRQMSGYNRFLHYYLSDKPY